MKVVFALLTDHHTHNAVRALAVALDREHGIGLQALPPHVSLNMSFPVVDMAAADEYFTEFARSVPPLTLALTALGVWRVPAPDGETGVLYIDVAEDAPLRAMHTRLNRELAARFEGTQAAFDGLDFHFHLTLMHGNVPFAVYQQIGAQHKHAWQPRRCAVTQMALFYIDDTNDVAKYTTYMILPLGQAPQDAS